MSRRWVALHLLLATLGVLPALHAGHVPGDGVDAYGTDWFYWWIRTCMAHGGDLSHTPLFFWPDGKDVFAHTGNNFVDAVWAAPFAWLLGPVTYLAPFYVLIQLGNALTFRPFAVELLGERDGAVAALLWQVNPYVIFELAAGRPTQAVLWFVPAVFLGFLRCARAPGLGPILLLGTGMAMAGWTYWFNGHFLVFALLLLLPFALRDAPDRRRTVLAWGAAAGVCAVFVLPMAWAMAGAVGAGAVPGVGGEAPAAIANNVEAELHGLWLVETRGEPLFTNPAWLVLLLASLGWYRSRWTVVLGGLLVVGLGAGVHLGGDPTPGPGAVEGLLVENPLYLWLYRVVPFFDRLWFPYRIAGVAFLPATLLVAPLLRGRPAWVGAFLIVSLAGQHAVWPFPHHDPRPPGIVQEVTRAPGGVVMTPMKIQHDGLSWQTFFQRPTLGGMGESAAVFWPEGYRRRLKNPFVRALHEAAARPGRAVDYDPEDRAAILDLGFRWLVLRLDLVAQLADQEQDRTGKPVDLERRRDEAVRATTAVVGHGPLGFEGEVVVWDLRAPAP